MNNIRGVITNESRARQLRDFSGLTYGKITPTDIDLFIEYRGHSFVFAEIKMPGHDIPQGQRMALERNVDGLRHAGKIAVLFLAENNQPDPEIAVDVSSCVVVKLYFCGRWRNGDGTTLKCWVDRVMANAHETVGGG